MVSSILFFHEIYRYIYYIHNVLNSAKKWKKKFVNSLFTKSRLKRNQSKTTIKLIIFFNLMASISVVDQSRYLEYWNSEYQSFAILTKRNDPEQNLIDSMQKSEYSLVVKRSAKTYKIMCLFCIENYHYFSATSSVLRIRRRRSPLHQFAESLLERTRQATTQGIFFFNFK